MITGRGQAVSGKPALLLGLTDDNIERLKQGKPIRVPPPALEHTGFGAIEVVILYGKTQADVMAQLETGDATVKAG